MTQDELTIINAELSKLLTPEQTKHAMRILRGFRADATANEKDTALVSLETLKIVWFNLTLQFSISAWFIQIRYSIITNCMHS